jgi:hypothetical protein
LTFFIDNETGQLYLPDLFTLIATVLDKARYFPEAGEVRVTEQFPALELAVTLSILVVTFLPFTLVVTFVAFAEQEPLVLNVA